MHFKSFSDLSQDIKGNMHKLQGKGIDLVIGLPRSGMVPAYMIALSLNVHCIDLPAFLRNEKLCHGRSRKVGKELDHAWDARTALLVDDSILSGDSMRQALEQIPRQFTGNLIKMAIYAVSARHEQIDLHFERVPIPRVFEWNVYHHGVLARACVDIDGVLCLDPTDEQNDDGAGYRNFLRGAQPLFLPSVKIHSLVTNRLEKYRNETEAWLKDHAIEYENLIMLDLPSKEERQRRGIHAAHKAEYYKASRLDFFLESEPAQASAIARMTGKPVFCTGNNQLYRPSGLRTAYADPSLATRRMLQRLKRSIPVSLKVRLRNLQGALFRKA